MTGMVHMTIRIARQQHWRSSKWAFIFFLTLFVPIAFGADPDEKPRWAVIPLDDSGKGLSDLLSVELSRWDRVSMVERTQIDNVLAELRLAASGLVDPKESLKFGEIAKADALVLLGGDRDGGCRLRLVETRTSIRFLDLFLPVSGLEKDLAAIQNELEMAFCKISLPVAKRNFLAVAPIKSEEPGDYLQPLCKALTPLVEVELTRQPDMVVLERSELQRLRAESQLSGLQLDMQGAMRLLEVGIRRRTGSKELEVNCSMDVPGKAAHRFRLSVATLDVVDVRAAIVNAVAKQFEGSEKVVDNPISPKAEALAFDRRREWFSRAHKHFDAVEMAETALALDPTLDRVYVTLAEYGSCRIVPKTPPYPSFKKRMIELHSQRLELISRIEDSAKFLSAFSRAGSDVKTNEMMRSRYPVFDIKLSIPDELKNRAKHDMADRLERAGENPDLRAKELERNLALLPYLTNSRSEYIAEMPELFLEFVSSSETFKNTDSQDIEFFSQVTLRRMSFLDPFYRFLDEALSRGEAIPDTTYFQNQLKGHESLSVRMANLHGQSHFRDARGTQAALELLVILRNAPLKLQKSTLGNFRTEMFQRLSNSSQEAELWDAVIEHAKTTGDATELLHEIGSFNGYLSRCATDRKQLIGTSVLSILALQKDKRPQLEFVMGRLKNQMESNANSDSSNELHATRTSESPWDAYERKSIQLKNVGKERRYLVDVHVRKALNPNHDDEIILVWQQKVNWEYHLSLEKIGLSGGTPIPISPPIVGKSSIHKVLVELTPDAILVASNQPGLTVIDRKTQKVELFTQADGAPSDEILSMAMLGNRLYIGFKDSFASFDPKTKAFQLLASSVSATPRSPFDGRNFTFTFMLADEANGCLWMNVQRFPGSGFWRFFPDKDQYVNVNNSNVVFAPSNESFFFYTFDREKSWKRVDRKSGNVTKLNYSGIPESVATLMSYHRDPGFVVLDNSIVSQDGDIYTEDGKIHRYPEKARWRWTKRLGDGFIVDYDSQSETLWYFERK